MDGQHNFWIYVLVIYQPFANQLSSPIINNLRGVIKWVEYDNICPKSEHNTLIL